MTIIKVQNVSHRFSNQEYVLNNINLNIPEGSIYGFLGPNVAGKTTTLRLILGLIKKTNRRNRDFREALRQQPY